MGNKGIPQNVKIVKCDEIPGLCIIRVDGNTIDQRDTLFYYPTNQVLIEDFAGELEVLPCGLVLAYIEDNDFPFFDDEDGDDKDCESRSSCALLEWDGSENCSYGDTPVIIAKVFRLDLDKQTSHEILSVESLEISENLLLVGVVEEGEFVNYLFQINEKEPVTLARTTSRISLSEDFYTIERDIPFDEIEDTVPSDVYHFSGALIAQNVDEFIQTGSIVMIRRGTATAVIDLSKDLNQFKLQLPDEARWRNYNKETLNFCYEILAKIIPLNLRSSSPIARDQERALDFAAHIFRTANQRGQ